MCSDRYRCIFGSILARVWYCCAWCCCKCFGNDVCLQSVAPWLLSCLSGAAGLEVIFLDTAGARPVPASGGGSADQSAVSNRLEAIVVAHICRHLLEVSVNDVTRTAAVAARCWSERRVLPQRLCLPGYSPLKGVVHACD